jgi:MYXO-CTERM domain-containing protein
MPAHTIWTMSRPALACAVFGALLLLPKPAHAHFILQTPDSWMSEDSAGAPEKAGPCGNEGGGTPTNKVTAYQEGQKITVTIDEVVFHPGHYRISLSMKGATDGDKVQADFPDDPTVTAGPPFNSGTMACASGPAMPCGSVPIQEPPVFPVLADDVFEHCTAFSAPQSVTITLPANVTCEKCTLQVLEFMSDHGLNQPGGCFYHHCADVSIAAQNVVVDGGANATDANESPTQDASVVGESGAASGSPTTSSGSPESTGAAGSGETESTGSSSGSSGTAMQPTSGATSSGFSGGGAGQSGQGSSSPSSGGGCSTHGASGTEKGGAAALLLAMGFMRWRRRR